MVKFGSNFCYCAVDQEKAVFQWKRAVSATSGLLGLEMVKFASNFCYCAVDQEKTVYGLSGPSCCRPRKSRFSMETGSFWPIWPFGARNCKICFEFLHNGPPEMVKFASSFCYCSVDQEKAVFQRKRAVSGPFALTQKLGFRISSLRRARLGAIPSAT